MITTPPTPIVIAFDPSLSCTGFAVIPANLGDTRLVDAGTISADVDGDAYTRAKSITDQALDVIEQYADTDKRTEVWSVASVVIEAPQVVSRGFKGKRSAATAPNYGIIVGALTYAVDLLRGGYGFELQRPSATEWTRGYPATHGDPHKTRRVSLVEHIYNLTPGDLGAMTTAGNVADAVLLARWAAARIGVKA